MRYDEADGMAREMTARIRQIHAAAAPRRTRGALEALHGELRQARAKAWRELEELVEDDEAEGAPAKEVGPLPYVGIGVTTGSRPEGFRVAVRAWRPQDWETPALEPLHGLPTDQVDLRITGPVRTLPGGPGGQAPRRRPLVAGSSIGHVNLSAGTLGAFVRAPDGALLALSCNHVLVEGNARTGEDAILQPGRKDGGLQPGDVVGALDRFARLTYLDNVADAAAASILPEAMPTDTGLPGLGPITGACSMADVRARSDAAALVQKVGRSTGLTRGRIRTMYPFHVGYPEGLRPFASLIEVEGEDGRPFSADGDSGALVVDGDRIAVGLVVAGYDGGTLICPIAGVLEALGVTLVR